MKRDMKSKEHLLEIMPWSADLPEGVKVLTLKNK